ncbi:MAG TPA: hypothetical protein VFO98_00810 [Marmoricola sp.]|nr:hypothetical protein [Marmoricola sp.]
MSARRDLALLALFDDLELQLEGLRLEDRAHDVAALAEAEYAEVTLEARLLGSLRAPLALRLDGDLLVRGDLLRAGQGWVLLGDDRQQPWLVLSAAVVTVAGLGSRSTAPEARTVLARLRIGSALRALATEHGDVLLHLRAGRRVEGRLGRVGADFVEAVTAGGTEVVPFGALSAVQGRG